MDQAAWDRLDLIVDLREEAEDQLRHALKHAEHQATKRLTQATVLLMIATIALVVVTGMLVFKTEQESEHRGGEPCPAATSVVEHPRGD
jgi:hypothetical protein